MQVIESKKKRSYHIRIVATNGSRTRALSWVNVRPNEVQCGVSAAAYRYHSSFHQSGDIRISKEHQTQPMENEAIAVGQTGEPPSERKPLDQLTGKERVGAFVLPIDKNSLGDYHPFRKKAEHDSVIYVDTRCFPRGCVSIEAWVSPPGHFFQRMPKPPGFRSIFDLSPCWVIIDIGDQ